MILQYSNSNYNFYNITYVKRINNARSRKQPSKLRNQI